MKHTFKIFAVICTLVIVYLCFFYSDFQERAREKEGLTLLNSFFVAIKATTAEYGSLEAFSEKNPVTTREELLAAIGFALRGQMHYQIYVFPQEIPEPLSSRLPTDFQPFYSPPKYRAIAVSINKNLRKATVFKKENDSSITKIIIPVDSSK
jgi:hypothetical protein